MKRTHYLQGTKAKLSALTIRWADRWRLLPKGKAESCMSTPTPPLLSQRNVSLTFPLDPLSVACPVPYPMILATSLGVYKTNLVRSMALDLEAAGRRHTLQRGTPWEAMEGGRGGLDTGSEFLALQFSPHPPHSLTYPGIHLRILQAMTLDKAS